MNSPNGKKNESNTNAVNVIIQYCAKKEKKNRTICSWQRERNNIELIEILHVLRSTGVLKYFCYL